MPSGKNIATEYYTYIAQLPQQVNHLQSWSRKFVINCWVCVSVYWEVSDLIPRFVDMSYTVPNVRINGLFWTQHFIP